MKHSTNSLIFLKTVSPSSRPVSLRQFMRCLELLNLGHPKRYSYYGPEQGLLPNLNLYQNIFLQSPHGTMKEKLSRTESSFQDHFQGNLYLQQLYERLQFPDCKAAEATASDCQLALLLGFIVRQGPLMLMASPSKGLPTATAQLLLKALVYLVNEQAEKHHRHTLIIAEQETEQWMTAMGPLLKGPSLHLEHYQLSFDKFGQVEKFEKTPTPEQNLSSLARVLPESSLAPTQNQPTKIKEANPSHIVHHPDSKKLVS